MTTKILCLGLTVGLTLGCGGNSKSDGGHTPSGGAAGTSAGASGGSGGAGGEAGSRASLGGDEAGGSGGGAARGGSSSGATGGGAGAATGGTRAAAGTSGSAGVGRGGRNQAEAGTGGVGAAGQMSSGGAAGEDTAGAAGVSGTAGSDGATCGGIAAKMCAPGQWCHWSNGSCGVGDQPGECFSSGGIACAPYPACGCDGHAYTLACRAHANGVDTTSDKACVPGDGAPGDPCFVDTDCESTLKCCTSPIGLMTCMTAASGTCPLTP